MKQWEALPRSKRERLTKKQIARIDKPDLMTDALSMATVREKKNKGTVVVVESTNKSNESVLDFVNQKASTMGHADRKVFKEDQPQKATNRP